VERTRTRVARFLTRSAGWEIHETLLEVGREADGFQYVDWCIEGDDIIAVSRTAFDDGLGGAHDCHDATSSLPRVKGFRAAGGSLAGGGIRFARDEATGRERG